MLIYSNILGNFTRSASLFIVFMNFSFIFLTKFIQHYIAVIPTAEFRQIGNNIVIADHFFYFFKIKVRLFIESALVMVSHRLTQC